MRGGMQAKVPDPPSGAGQVKGVLQSWLALQTERAAHARPSSKASPAHGDVL